MRPNLIQKSMAFENENQKPVMKKRLQKHNFFSAWILHQFWTDFADPWENLGEVLGNILVTKKGHKRAKWYFSIRMWFSRAFGKVWEWFWEGLGAFWCFKNLWKLFSQFFVIFDVFGRFFAVFLLFLFISCLFRLFFAFAAFCLCQALLRRVSDFLTRGCMLLLL